MKVLLVEDDVVTASFIQKGLTQAGFSVEYACDGENGKQRMMTGEYDVAVVDLMLPKLDGLALIRDVRAAKVKVPVIILSAKGSVDERIQGLQEGGDDYLTKPFAYVL